MSSVWISKDSWAKVWAAIHNIRVRMNFTVKEPSVSLSGQGASARINIDLPCPRSGEGKIYDGPFAVSYSQEEKALVVNAGWINVNGIFLKVKHTVITEFESGLLCLQTGISQTGDIAEPEYVFSTADKSCYPICYVDVNGDGVTLNMYHVPPVIPYIIAKECPFAMK